ncbi:MAG: NERD domain-containing protein [Deltaproteobacteria bacterium]|nr:NERD domain-containing protein [Deltaproteobacteria bacterium]
MRHLPQGWQAWHSLKLDTGSYLEAEADFVVASPEHGFIVLEVKSGKMRVEDGHWFQNSHRLQRAPIDQATNFAHHLSNRIKRETGELVPFVSMVAFPDVDTLEGKPSDDLVRYSITGKDLGEIATKLKATLEIASGNGRNPPKSADWIKLIHRLWGHTWTTKPSLISDVLEIPIKLTDTQLAILDGLVENPALLIEGGPGTGKSFIAREAASRFKRAGREVLYLCFTDPLAKWMSFELKGKATVRTLRRLAADLAGVSPTNSDDWASVTNRAIESWSASDVANPFLKWLKEAKPVVLLDESQDLAEDDWLLVNQIVNDLGKPGELSPIWWSFADSDQTILPFAKLEISFFPARFRLGPSYRAPLDLVNANGLFREASQSNEPLTVLHERIVPLFRNEKLSGPVARLKWTETKDDLDNEVRVAIEVDQLIKEGFKRNQIAVCSVRGRDEKRSLNGKTRIGSHPCVPADHDSAPLSLIVDTFARLKGLERPAIVVTDIHLMQPGREAELMKRLYVAATRAQICVRIVGPIPMRKKGIGHAA